MTARELDVGRDSIVFVAAHLWGVAGAAKAGCTTAFLKRPRQVLDELTPEPKFIAADIRELADQLLGVQEVA